MTSPFPGMDPFLEGDLWQEFHQTLAGAIRARLSADLPERYVALLAKRYVVDRGLMGVYGDVDGRVVYPDVHIVDPDKGVRETLASAPVPVLLASPMAELVPLTSVEVRDIAGRRLVTAFELLSPVNKRSDGMRDYLARRLDLLATDTHLVEIDLLRGGERIRLLGRPPDTSYYVYLSRADRRPTTEVWPIDLRAALPTLTIPLLPGDPDVALDLQAAFADCFALVGYDRLIDYTVAPPPPPLDQADAGWVASRVAMVRTPRGSTIVAIASGPSRSRIAAWPPDNPP